MLQGLSHPYLIITLFVLFGLGLTLLWQSTLGWNRAILAGIFRLLWLSPFILALFPRTLTEGVPSSLTGKPLHILLDDSNSMRKDANKPTWFEQAQTIRELVEKRCLRLGCSPRTSLLSQLDDRTKKGMTPLSSVLGPWLLKTGGDPWLLVSDGGDFRPEMPWDNSMAGIGLDNSNQHKSEEIKTRGLILGYPAEETENLAIDDVDLSPFAFESKPVELTVHISRSRALAANQRVQVQVALGESIVASVNATFASKDLMLSMNLTIASLPKGVQLLEVRVLPTGDEKYLWDNQVLRTIEVMPNTVGILHLLGSPNWDGRFVRRYLKSEPKYDLISFYILRDPSDMQQANERELSLIPFPVDRLFREELPNFRSCIIQNFSLTRFLQPEYQENLVKFVQEGGGLLFIGGPRALKAFDLTSSPLRAILPFEAPNIQDSHSPDPVFNMFDEGLGGGREEDEDRGSTYDANLKFTVLPAAPDASKRALANVYDDWEQLAPALASLGSLQGMHNTSQFRFKDAETTPLLLAKTDNGKTMPLAVASYPGKGRALWLFSDQLWHLAMSDQWDAPRSAYNHLITSAMTWLLRQDLRKPLLVKDFTLNSGGGEGNGQWSAIIQGPAARYIEPTKDWQVEVCGVRTFLDQVAAERFGQDEWLIKGNTSQKVHGGQRCRFMIEGAHGAFGSVNAGSATIVPRTLDDNEIGSAPAKLRSLGKLTGAKVAFFGTSDSDNELDMWLENITDKNIQPPLKQKTKEDRFWILSSWWLGLLLLGLPLEVVARRWHEWFKS